METKKKYQKPDLEVEEMALEPLLEASPAIPGDDQVHIDDDDSGDPKESL